MTTSGPAGTAPAFDAIVLSGGASRRLGGVDKGTIDVAGTTLLHRALDTCAGARLRVVVGPQTDLPSGVVRTREDPPGGGPVAAIASGMRLVAADVVVCLACDMPFVSAEQVGRLVRLVGDGTGAALLVDADGRRQPLAAAYDTPALTSALSALPTVHGASMHRLCENLTVHETPADAGTTTDCDTWPHVHDARRRLEHP